MKKQLLLFISLLLPLVAMADDSGSCGTDVTYTYETSTGTLTIQGSGTMTGYSYSSFAPWYSYRSNIKTVVIKDGVTSIGSYAFYYCNGLTSIEIPNSVTSIGDHAFYFCNGLTSIEIPNSVTSIGDYAFSGTAWLNSQPDGLIYAGKVVYCYKGTMPVNTSITIKEGTLGIANIAFYGCSSLTSIDIPNSVTRIGKSAFSGCSGLTSVTIPNSVTRIGKSAFSGCSCLTSVTIPNSVTNIEEGTFYGCRNLVSVTIPNSVKTIGPRAFDSLESVVIGSGVVDIDKDVFHNHVPAKVYWLPSVPPNGYNYVSGKVNYVVNDKYDKLSRKIIYPTLNNMFEIDGVVYVPISLSDKTCDIIDCSYDSKVTTFVINNSIKYRDIEMNVLNVQPYAFYSNKYLYKLNYNLEVEVPNYAFQNCINLESVELGDLVTCVGESSFEGCSKLYSLSMGKNLKIIKSLAFKNCKMLKDLELGKNLEVIGRYSFCNCKSISEIKCPQRLTKIMDYAFSGCILKMVTFEVDKGESDCRRQILEDFNAEGYSATNKKYSFEVEAGDQIVFDYYTNCRDYMHTFLTVTLNGKEIIHEDGNIDSCYVHTFTEAKKVALEINLHRFYSGTGSAKVYNIEIGNNNRLSLGSNGKSSLFSDCIIDELNIGRKIVFQTSSDDGYSPFANIATLKSVVISNKEAVLPDYVFYGCHNLKNVTLDDNTETIGTFAFYGCTNINNFVIGPRVTQIREEAFSGCDGLTKLVCYAENPPVCGTYAIGGINKFNCTLYVPETSIADYKTAEQWKEFWNIQSLDPTNIDRNTLVPSQNYYHYDLNGNLLLQPHKGVNILKSSNGKTKKVLVK